MSAIRKLIELVRRKYGEDWDFFAESNSAEAELKEVTSGAERLIEAGAELQSRVRELEGALEGVTQNGFSLSRRLIERDRADAELRAFVTSRQCLEADRHSIDPTYGHVSDECVMCVLARWAAKGGKECAWCGRVACDIEEHKQRPLRAPEPEKCPKCGGPAWFYRTDPEGDAYASKCESTCLGTGKAGGK